MERVNPGPVTGDAGQEVPRSIPRGAQDDACLQGLDTNGFLSNPVLMSPPLNSGGRRRGTSTGAKQGVCFEFLSASWEKRMVMLLAVCGGVPATRPDASGCTTIMAGGNATAEETPLVLYNPSARAKTRTSITRRPAWPPHRLCARRHRKPPGVSLSSRTPLRWLER